MKTKNPSFILAVQLINQALKALEDIGICCGVVQVEIEYPLMKALNLLTEDSIDEN